MFDSAFLALPSDPLAWTPPDMWAWVNQFEPLRLRNGMHVGARVRALGSEGGARRIIIAFERPSLVASQGYTWDHHIDDEMLSIHIAPDEVTLGVIENLSATLAARLVAIVAMLRCADADIPRDFIGRIEASLGDSDWGKSCLSFASQSKSAWLIPDPYFVLTCAYAEEKDTVDAQGLPWSEREPIVYWRGAASGMQKYASHRDSQRVKLIMIANSGAQPARFQAKFTNIDDIGEDVRSEIISIGGQASPDPQMDIVKYKYNVDVDGWSCAWTGFFLKLLAGSPVLKIESDLGFKQWYYTDLRPWVHFVPISKDLSDLEFALGVLQSRPDIADEIGRNGRSFALSMNMESQILLGSQLICRFINAQIFEN